MAEKNITRKQALENAIAKFEEGDETRVVLEKMLAQIAKPRKVAKSKARLLNENLAEKVFNKTDGKPVTSKDVTNMGIAEIASTQKAVAVLRVGVEMGYFEKVTDEKKRIAYKPIAE